MFSRPRRRDAARKTERRDEISKSERDARVTTRRARRASLASRRRPRHEVTRVRGEKLFPASRRVAASVVRGAPTRANRIERPATARMLRSAVLTWSAVERAVLNGYSQIALVREREGQCVVRKNRKRVKHASRRALTETRRDEVPKRVRDAARAATGRDARSRARRARLARVTTRRPRRSRRASRASRRRARARGSFL